MQVVSPRRRISFHQYSRNAFTTIKISSRSDTFVIHCLFQVATLRRMSRSLKRQTDMLYLALNFTKPQFHSSYKAAARKNEKRLKKLYGFAVAIERQQPKPVIRLLPSIRT